MTEFITSRDLAATELFLPSYEALHHTFRSVALAVTSKYPESKGGNIHLEFWGDGNVYWARYYLNTKLNPSGSKFYMAIGICFPGREGFASQNFEKFPQDEAFFFVLFADDWENKKASEFLLKIPEGWVEAAENSETAVARPLSDFEPDPDVRAKSLIAWVREEAGRLMACIPNFETAPIENIPEEQG
jgi:hypothetical protein